MTRDERRLLENVLDALDRLFDGASTVIDVHALLFATRQALADSRFGAAFEQPLHRLGGPVRRNGPRVDRESAVALTDELRAFVVQAMDEDEQANPRGRHDR